jgi:hypothetical protein
LLGTGVHVPFAPVRLWPDCAVPETDGSGDTVNAPGGGGGGGAAGPCTTAVWPDVTAVEPFLFVATTTIRKVDPASALVGVYDEALEPAETHESPEAPHRCHEIENEGVGPAQLPGSAVNCPPTTADPEIDGGVVDLGADLPGPAADETATGMPARQRKRNALR